MDSRSERHVTARICVEGKTVLMRIVEQRGIERGCGRIPVGGAPLAVASGNRGPYLVDTTLGLRGGWVFDDHNVERTSFKSQPEAREYAAKLAETIAAINGDPARGEDVPCKECGRPGVLVEYPTASNPWVVRCRDMGCNSPMLGGVAPAEAWAEWGKANRGAGSAIDFPEGVFVTIGDQDD